MASSKDVEGMATQLSKENNADDNPNDTKDSNNNHLRGLQLYLLLVSLFLLVLIITLDISILSTAIPRITDDFHTIADIGWYGSAFLIAQCSLQPLSGRIYSFFPFENSLIVFLAIFELGSLLCGVAVSSKMLVVGRAVCGIGSAGLVNGSLSIIGVAAPPEKRPMMMGIFMTVASSGQVIGPLVGGGLTSGATWRWCFYLNLPVGAVTLAGLLFVKLPANPNKKKNNKPLTLFKELDIAGFLVFAPASVMLLLALEWGGSTYSWNSATIIGLLCGSGIVFISFIFWEARHPDTAMIPGPIVGIRQVYVSCVTAAFQGGGMLIITYYLPLWFQTIKGKIPIGSAVSNLPNFISQVIAGFAIGALASKLGYLTPPMVLGNALCAIAYGLLSTLKAGTGEGHWIGYQILSGVGRGVSLQMPILAVQGAVPPAKIAAVTGILMWSQFLGGAIMLSAAQTLFVNLLRSALRIFAPSLDAGAIIAAGATGFTSVVAPQNRPEVLTAYNRAITHTFYLGIAVSGTALITSLGLGSLKVDVKNTRQAAMGSTAKAQDAEK